MNSPPSLSRGNGHSDKKKIAVMEQKRALITQFRLARIQQLQADIVRYDDEIVGIRRVIARDKRELKKDWSILRKEVLRGAEVEPGPLTALLRNSGKGTKRRKILVVK